MYIRQRPNKDKAGNNRYGYALCESRRVNGVPKAFTLLNLGQGFDVARKDWDLLTDLVELVLRKQRHVFTDIPKEVEKARDKILVGLEEIGYSPGAAIDQREAIVVEHTQLTDIRSIGGERVAIKALEELGFGDLLGTLGMSVSQRQLAQVLVVGRMLSPGSERHTYDWMRHRSGILEVLGADRSSSFGLSSLYRMGDSLHVHRKALMDGMFGRSQALLDFRPKVVFYDLTNMYYTGRKRGDILRHGRSKEKRVDYPLVTLALTIDESGFPRSADIYPGNISEPGTFKRTLEAVGVVEGATIVMDAGICSKENRAYMAQKKWHWVSIDRSKPTAYPAGPPDGVINLSHTQLKVWALPGDATEKKVYVHSQARKRGEDRLLKDRREAFEKALDALALGLTKPRHLKDYNKVQRAVGRLQEKYKTVSHQYDIRINKKEASPNASDIVYTQRPVHKTRTDTSGGYIIRSSQIEASIEDLVTQYHGLNDIEQTFRVLKSDLKVRPIYHQKDSRIEAHICIAILAYYAVHLIRMRLKEQGIHASWKTLQTEFTQWVRSDVILEKTKYKKIYLSIDATPKGLQKDIARIMKIPQNRNLVKKIIDIKRQKK